MSCLSSVGNFFSDWMGVRYGSIFGNEGEDHDTDGYLVDDWLLTGGEAPLSEMIKKGCGTRILILVLAGGWNALAFFGNMARFAGYALATISLVGLAIGAYKGDTLLTCRYAFSNLKFMGHNLAMLVKFTVGVIPFVNQAAAALVSRVSGED